MKKRSFRVYAEKEDLENVFKEFQNTLAVYYVPAYSDTGEVSFDDIMNIADLGVNFNGSHIGNVHILAFLKTTECLWRSYQYRENNGKEKRRYSTLAAGNSSCISIALNGIYKEDAIFPTEISTMHYDEEDAKKLYNELKKIFRRHAVKIIQGYYICPNAYKYKSQYRFCKIDIKSPREYDLEVD